MAFLHLLVPPDVHRQGAGTRLQWYTFAMQDFYSDESSDDQWQSQELSSRLQQQQQAHVNRAGPDTEDSGDSEDDEEPKSPGPAKRQKKSAADARPAALQQAAGAGGSNQAAEPKVRRQREQAFSVTGRAALLQRGCAQRNLLAPCQAALGVQAGCACCSIWLWFHWLKPTAVLRACTLGTSSARAIVYLAGHYSSPFTLCPCRVNARSLLKHRKAPRSAPRASAICTSHGRSSEPARHWATSTPHPSR